MRQWSLVFVDGKYMENNTPLRFFLPTKNTICDVCDMCFLQMCPLNNPFVIFVDVLWSCSFDIEHWNSHAVSTGESDKVATKSAFPGWRVARHFRVTSCNVSASKCVCSIPYSMKAPSKAMCVQFPYLEHDIFFGVRYPTATPSISGKTNPENRAAPTRAQSHPPNFEKWCLVQ